MVSGRVFDVREFTVHDGPGIRTTVFLKGCPLRCSWCHNPEGLSGTPQILKSRTGERLVGHEFTDEELADLLNRQAPVLRSGGGGVTFSGGEPLMQAQFLSRVIDRLEQVHTVLDTSGYASEQDFRLVVGKCDLVFFDIKIIDPAAHMQHTGCDNAPILRNLRVLGEMGKAFHARVPLVPGITDTEENLAAIAKVLEGVTGLVQVDLLKYNRAAGGKYEACGMTFSPDYNESIECNIDTNPFEDRGLKAVVV